MYGVKRSLISGRASLTLEVVTEISQLNALHSDWLRLLDSIVGVTPLHMPEWLLTWWLHFQNGELRVFVFRDGNSLVGLVPCLLHNWAGRRQLTLLGSGVSDYLEPPIHPHFIDQMPKMLQEHLTVDREWEVCDWQDLNASSPLFQLSESKDFAAVVSGDTPCSEIPLHGAFDEYWANRPHGLRRNVRRYLNKARQIDTPRFQMTQSAEKPLIDALIRLHTLRWQQRGESGMIAANRSSAFLQDVAREFAQTGNLRLMSLTFQDRVAAVIMGFEFRNICYSYLSAFDPEYESFGFGKTLLYESLRYGFQTGWKSWNFMRGEEPYKLDWGAQMIPKNRLVITRSV